jgi:RNA polymerase sigma-19 factor, ECF subfamily
MKLDFDLYWDKIRNGDERALETVYKTIFRSLVYYASEITTQSQLAEEVVQDVFLKIWQNRSQLKIQESFKSYIFRTVHNHALNVVRQQNTKKESINQICSETSWQFISDTYDINDDLIEKIFSHDTEILIEKIIRELPEQCRKVFIMSRIESLTNEEIAGKLDLSNNTVKTHIYRALQKISVALKKEK